MDLGAIPEFYDKPRQYAAFLDQEISFGRKVPLVVVMPDGYGSAALPPAATALIASLPKPTARTANVLTEAAIAAVRKLADAAGHPLGRTGVASSSSTSGSGSVAVQLAILVAVCAALAGGILAFRRRRAKPGMRVRR